MPYSIEGLGLEKRNNPSCLKIPRLGYRDCRGLLKLTDRTRDTLGTLADTIKGIESSHREYLLFRESSTGVWIVIDTFDARRESV